MARYGRKRKEEGRKTKRQIRVGCWTLTVACIAGKRLQETRKRRSAESDASKKRAGGAPWRHGRRSADPRFLLPRGRLKNSREVQRPNVWKGIHLRGSSLRSFFVWPWTPPRNFMRHIGVRGASRHDRRVRCAFGAIYDRHLEKHPHIWTLGVARICWWRR